MFRFAHPWGVNRGSDERAFQQLRNWTLAQVQVPGASLLSAARAVTAGLLIPIHNRGLAAGMTASLSGHCHYCKPGDWHLHAACIHKRD